jgi:hypothetical protein
MEDLLVRSGFFEDPFEYTDADREQRLDEYFVSPPYFDSVIGDARQPASTVVFAPRGSGKSAQRRTIEQIASEVDVARKFLCITYDEFDQPAGYTPISATWEYHVEQVIRGIALQLLVALETGVVNAGMLEKSDKEILSSCVNQYLG